MTERHTDITKLSSEHEVIGDVSLIDTKGNSAHDDNTGAVTTIKLSHNKVHDEDAYKSDTVDESMADEATLVLAFKTPNTTVWIHLIVELAVKAASHLEILEGPTWDTNSGTVNPIYNRNRNSSNVSVLLEDKTATPVFTATGNVLLNPSNLAGGTVIHDFYVFSDKKFGGQQRDAEEFILKQNKTYAIKIEADAATNAAQLTLNWYEHVNL